MTVSPTATKNRLAKDKTMENEAENGTKQMERSEENTPVCRAEKRG